MSKIDKRILFIDYGLFESYAVRLARDFKEVLYYCPWVDSDADIEKYLIGFNVPGLTKVYNLYEALYSGVDGVFFPDINDCDLQYHIKYDLKFPVWGSGYADIHENDRRLFYEFQKAKGMPVPKTAFVNGLDELREKLSVMKDVWVKGSRFRKNFETMHHISPSLSEPILNVKATTHGLHHKDMEFMIQSPIDGDEIGYDGFTVNGALAEIASWGIEVKNEGYVGKIMLFKDMPKQVIETTKPLASIFKEYQCSTNFSTEVRIDKKGVGYVLEPTMRLGQPPANCLMEAYSNLGEIIWGGMNGELITPKPVAKYVCECMIWSTWYEKYATEVSYPKEVSQWVKPRFFYVNDEGCVTCLPRTGYNIPVAVVGIGDTLDEATKKMQEVAKQVECIDGDSHADFIDDAYEKLEEMKDLHGIEF